ncbi:MAG: hypothetical protein IJ594_07345 [Oscillospiraceae bacterium]|nr:hypothetical protein [Oscillospiraceae bacterium]
MITTESDDFSFSMKEYPFYHEGMTVAEWKEERQYMADHMEEVKHGKYKPLWKQKNETLTMP